MNKTKNKRQPLSKLVKKVLITTLALSMTLSTATWSSQTEISQTMIQAYKLGDVDGSGEIKLADAQMALRAALNIIPLTTDQKTAADVNFDGEIKLNDAQMVLRAALNIIELSKEDVTVEERVLLNQNGVKITLKSLSFDGWSGPELKILIENNNDKSIGVQVRDESINGIMMDPIFSCNVEPGKKANDEITFMSSHLEDAGIEIIKDIELKFIIFDSETYETIFKSETIKITTSADPSYEQNYDDSGIVLLNENGFRVVVKRLETEDTYWGADLYLYIENNSDYDVTLQVRNVSINGFMISPIFSCDVMSGKKAFDEITILESSLTDNNITEIHEIELSFHIFDTENLGDDYSYDSEKVAIIFD